MPGRSLMPSRPLQPPLGGKARLQQVKWGRMPRGVAAGVERLHEEAFRRALPAGVAGRFVLGAVPSGVLGVLLGRPR